MIIEYQTMQLKSGKLIEYLQFIQYFRQRIEELIKLKHLRKTEQISKKGLAIIPKAKPFHRSQIFDKNGLLA